MAFWTTAQTKIASSPAVFFLDYAFPLAVPYAYDAFMVKFILDGYEPDIQKSSYLVSG